jgi:hypothetical protein
MNKIVQWSLKQRAANSATKLLLIELAFVADDAGRFDVDAAFLAERAMASEPKVIEMLSRLHIDGLLDYEAIIKTKRITGLLRWSLRH